MAEMLGAAEPVAGLDGVAAVAVEVEVEVGAAGGARRGRSAGGGRRGRGARGRSRRGRSRRGGNRRSRRRRQGARRRRRVAPADAGAEGVAGSLEAATGPAGVWPAAYWVRAARTSPEGAAPAGAAVEHGRRLARERGGAGRRGNLSGARGGGLTRRGGDRVAGTAIVSAAAMSEVGSALAADVEPSAELLVSEPVEPEPRPDASASVPSRFPPFVEVCLLWPSASAVRATWLTGRWRTRLSAGRRLSVGSSPGRRRWAASPGERRERPAGVAGPVPGAPVGPAEGASVLTAGIIDADPMPGLMRPSGGIR